MITNYIRSIKLTYFGLWLSYFYRKIKLNKSITKIKHNFINYLDIKNDYKINRSEGYKILEYPNFEELNKMVEFCEQNYSIDFINQNNKNKSKGGRLKIVDIDLNDSKNQIVKDFCLNKKIIKTISNYLNEIPILFNVQVWFSPNQTSDDLLGSQLYHFDREDFRQIKCFIPIENIDKESGPLTLISSKNSFKFIIKKLKNLQIVSSKGRFKDKEIKKNFKHNVEIPLECKRGQIAMIDTTQCLHYGSRPAQKYKYHLSIQYVSPYSSKLDKISKYFSQINNADDLIYSKLNYEK